jgi:hypothetical protein
VQIAKSDNKIIFLRPGEVDNIRSFAFAIMFGEERQQTVVYKKTDEDGTPYKKSFRYQSDTISN